jgi:hypothetical protein
MSRKTALLFTILAAMAFGGPEVDRRPRFKPEPRERVKMAEPSAIPEFLLALTGVAAGLLLLRKQRSQ